MKDGSVPSSRKAIAIMAAVFWVAVAWSAIRPFHPKDYLLEIVTPVGGFLLLLAAGRRFRFTTLSCLLMLLEGIVLIVGAHYTHALVPLFDWIKEAFTLSRNHYDRFAHFCVGLFMAIPAREILRRATPLRGGWLQAMSVVSLLAFGGFYEITEWWIAIAVSPEAAEAYLGSQGDPWDAQKDMVLDTLGAAAAMVLFTRSHDRQLERIQ